MRLKTVAHKCQFKYRPNFSKVASRGTGFKWMVTIIIFTKAGREPLIIEVIYRNVSILLFEMDLCLCFLNFSKRFEFYSTKCFPCLRRSLSLENLRFDRLYLLSRQHYQFVGQCQLYLASRKKHQFFSQSQLYHSLRLQHQFLSQRLASLCLEQQQKLC